MLLILYARSKKYNTVNDLRRGLKSHFTFVLGTIACIHTMPILQSPKSAQYQAGPRVHGPCESRCGFRFCLDDSPPRPASDDSPQHKPSRLSSSKLRSSQEQSPITTYTNKHTTSSTSVTSSSLRMPCHAHAEYYAYLWVRCNCTSHFLHCASSLTILDCYTDLYTQQRPRNAPLARPQHLRPDRIIPGPRNLPCARQRLGSRSPFLHIQLGRRHRYCRPDRPAPQTYLGGQRGPAQLPRQPDTRCEEGIIWSNDADGGDGCDRLWPLWLGFWGVGLGRGGIGRRLVSWFSFAAGDRRIYTLGHRST